MQPSLILVLLCVAALVTLIAVCRTPIARGMHRRAGVVGGFGVRDAALKLTRLLPDGAATVYSDGFDLAGGSPAYGASSRPDFLAQLEMLLSAPVLAVGQLANASTMTYAIQTDSDPAFGSPKTLIASAIVQTGDNGAGAATASYRFRLPTDVERYLRVAITNSAAADASAASATLEALF